MKTKHSVGAESAAAYGRGQTRQCGGLRAGSDDTATGKRGRGRGAGGGGLGFARGDPIAESDTLPFESSGPINALDGFGILGGFQQMRFDEDLSGGGVQFGQKFLHGLHFALRGNDDQLTGARVGQHLAFFGKSKLQDRN